MLSRTLLLLVALAGSAHANAPGTTLRGQDFIDITFPSTVTVTGPLIGLSSITGTHFGDGSHLTGINTTDFGPSTAALSSRLNQVAVSTTAQGARQDQAAASTTSLQAQIYAVGQATPTFVTLTGDQLISGVKTFTSTITINAQDANGYSLKLSSSVQLSCVKYGDGTIQCSAASGNSSSAITSTASISWVYDNFLAQANGVTTVFTLSQTPSQREALRCAMDGLTQAVGVDYTYSAPTTVTFTTAPASNSNSLFCYYTVNTSTTPGVAILTSTNSFTAPQTFTFINASSITVSGGITAGSFTGDGSNLTNVAGTRWARDNFIGQVNGVTTAFTLSQTPISGNSLAVILDGLDQSTTDYTYTPPFTVTMTTAPAANSSSFFIRYPY